MKQSKGFTLVELLVVISIIAILITTLVPSIAMLRSNFLRNSCKIRLQQLHALTVSYAWEHKAVVPAHNPIESNEYALWDENAQESWFLCPADKNPEYRWTYSYLAGTTMQHYLYPHGIITDKIAHRVYREYETGRLGTLFSDYTGFHPGKKPEERYNVLVWSGEVVTWSPTP